MNKKRLMFFKMIFSSIVRRRSRMIVALLAIIVGATILSGLVTIYYDVPRQMGAQFRNYGANMILTSSLSGDYISQEETEKAISYISDKELEGYTPFRYENTSVNNLPVTVAGTDFSGVSKTSPYWYINGSLPKSDGEALIGAKVAETFGLSAGDTLDALNKEYKITAETDRSLIPSYEIYVIDGEEYCDHKLSVKVSGILETGGSEEEYVYLSLADVSYLSLQQRGYDVVEISVATSSEKLSEYVNDITAGVSGISAKPVKRVTASESTVLTKLQSLVFIVTAVVLILTMICVATTMTAVIAERRKEIGLRKSLGASDGSIIGEFMSEGLILGGVGGLIGSLFGFLFAEIISVNVFSSSISFMPLLLPVTMAVSVIITGLACLLPIKSAVNVDPALVLKGE